MFHSWKRYNHTIRLSTVLFCQVLWFKKADKIVFNSSALPNLNGKDGMHFCKNSKICTIHMYSVQCIHHSPWLATLWKEIPGDTTRNNNSLVCSAHERATCTCTVQYCLWHQYVAEMMHCNMQLKDFFTFGCSTNNTGLWSRAIITCNNRERMFWVKWVNESMSHKSWVNGLTVNIAIICWLSLSPRFSDYA